MLDLLSRGNSEVATFGNLSNITNVRIYDLNSPDNGYILSKTNDNLGIFKETGNTAVFVGLNPDPQQSNIHPNVNFQVNGTMYSSNIGTYNNDNKLIFNNQNIGGISNIYFNGNLFQNGRPVLTNIAAASINTLVLRNTSIINVLTKNRFVLSGLGVIDITYDNIEVFINGIRYTYIDELNYDYTFTSTFDGKTTTFTITLVTPVNINDIVDITIWYTNTGIPVNLQRYSVINNTTTNIIDIPASGIVSVLPENIELFINGIRYSYIDTTKGDFTLTTTFDGSYTHFILTLTNTINPNDVIDVSLWTGIGNFNFTRYTAVADDSYSEFTVLANGINTASIRNVKLFINGIRYEYINDNRSDFTMYYTNDGTNTSYIFTLTNNISQGDVIDVTVYFGGETGGVTATTQWGGTRNIYFTAGNVGIGTTNPKYLLDVNGTLGLSNIATYNSNNNIYFNNQNIGGVSNIYFSGNLYQNGKSILVPTATGKNVLVLRNTFMVSYTTQTSFTLTGKGLINVVYNNIDVFINGIKFTYIDDFNTDYTFSTSYNGSTTSVTITMINALKQGDVVDISIWYGNAGANLNLSRYAFVNQTHTKVIDVPVSGIVQVLPTNIELYINGFRYTYLDSNNGDFTLSSYYDGSFTHFVLNLTNFINQYDIIDISLWNGIGDFNFARYTYKAEYPITDFNFISPGISTAVITNVKLFINGVRYEYISTGMTDFYFYYTNDGVDTTYYISLTHSISQNDVIDVTVYFGGAGGGGGVLSQWAGTNNIYFTAGNVGIGTTNPAFPLDLYGNFHTTGNVVAGGSITAFASDRRLKNKVDNITNAVSKVKSLSAFKFTFNDIAKEYGFDENEVHVGLVAQEVQAILPEIVKPAPFDWDVRNNKSISGKHYLTIQYEKLVPLLVEAIKEQAEQIEYLQKRVFQV